ncbi:hypothetical protein PIIN_03193 [Serendipita indica DSM 11827]|uniref:Uncharacterized protein n=1 Tax=Serendipita indica (strain DSM 11827) TaxID=1109443 RepID=G4TD79_SERID|nr:hypothetical protein PIIN_03193 [Serendipita indica DSM 11827]
MPKREATPEPGEDEPKYFTVVNPWPQNADMEIIGDFIRCCRWLASAIGDPELLLALFHKPSSPRIIIIEVSRQYEAPTHKTSSTYQRIIGKHSWVGSEGMLTNPAGYNERNCSSIFYSCFSTGREVEKNGWKRKWVEEHHLGDPKHPDPTFKIPYPKTTYIETPVLEPIARKLCRPLPRSEFDQLELPVVIAAPTAPVGSSTWAAIRKQKSASSSRSAAHPSQGTSDVYFEPTEPPISESTDTSMNLWAVGEGGAPVGLMSDLAQMSITGEDDEGVCPFHGTSCRKMCEWRTEYEKRRGPKEGGPSNIKNYGRKNNGRGASIPNNGRKHGQPVPPNITVRGGYNVTAARVSARAPPPPAHILAGHSGTQPPISPVSGNTPSLEGMANGSISATPSAPIRGAPAWSSRGRGRGRAV